MTPTQEAREREMTREALRRHWEIRAQDESAAITEARLLALEWRMAELEAMESQLRRISALNAEIGVNFASFRGKAQSRSASEG